MESKIYKPKDFAALLGVSVTTLQRWDRIGKLVAHRSPTNRRYYTQEHYLLCKDLMPDEEKKQLDSMLNALVDERLDVPEMPWYQKPLFTLKEASEYYNISVSRFQDLIKRPNCMFVLYDGGRILIKREEFDKFLKTTNEL